jgi:hypothetical protein
MSRCKGGERIFLQQDRLYCTHLGHWDPGSLSRSCAASKSACKRKGLFQDYDDAIEAESEAADDAKNFREAITNMTGPKSKKDAAAPNQPSLDELKASLKDTLLVQKEAQEVQTMASEGFFLLYVNLLSEQ